MVTRKISLVSVCLALALYLYSSYSTNRSSGSDENDQIAQAGYAAGSSDSTATAETSLDRKIESDFRAEMATNRLRAERIHGHARNAVLTLRGTVRSPALRDRVGDIASKVPNVVQVVNALDLTRPQPPRTPPGARD